MSTDGTKLMMADISNFHLNITLRHPEYLHLRLGNNHQKIIYKYKLQEKATPDGFVYKEVCKHESLNDYLQRHGYCQSKIVHGL